jgi:formylglycine-generating enzyme required for sulfatase activity
MKMKKTMISVCALLLVSAASMMTASGKPTLAVFVVGMATDTKSDDFATRLGSDLNRDGEYELVTSDIAVADKLAALRAAHTASTPADTGGLAAWGRQNGVDLVQLVVETGGTKIRIRTAQLLDCSTSQLVGHGTYRLITVPKGMENPLPEMVRVYGGVFEMGCKAGRDDKTVSCYDQERPLHTVNVRSFSISRYPITQAQWRAVMGDLPTSIGGLRLGDDKAVTFVSWNDISGADGYLDKLNELTGLNYRLPTEAEWEYAARGCDGGACESYLYSGSDNLNNVGCYSDFPPAVGSKAPNRLGIYDMSGYVFEWCRDNYSATYYTTTNNPLDNPENTSGSSYHTLRGGVGSSCSQFADRRRIAYRMQSVTDDDYRQYDTGFRLVLP